MIPEHVDPRAICHDHWQTLLRPASGRRDTGAVIAVVVLPVAAGCALGWIGWPSRDVVPTLVSAIAIVTGLLLNVLILVHGLFVRLAERTVSERARSLARHTHANIAFATLCAIVAIMCTLPLASELKNWPVWIVTTFRCVSASLLCLILMTLLMVVRRVHVLLSYDMN